MAIATLEPIRVDLSGVPETLLGNLRPPGGPRARIGALKEPVAIQVIGQLDYDFADFARGARLHALRVATFDRAIGRFLASHPSGIVVALGEGLESWLRSARVWRPSSGGWTTVRCGG